MTTTSHILLGDTSRDVGFQLCYSLSEHNQKITDLLNSQTTKTSLQSIGLKTVLGDTLDVAAMAKYMQQCSPMDYFINTIEGQRADYLGNKNLIEVSIKAGVKNCFLVSFLGAGSSNFPFLT